MLARSCFQEDSQTKPLHPVWKPRVTMPKLPLPALDIGLTISRTQFDLLRRGINPRKSLESRTCGAWLISHLYLIITAIIEFLTLNRTFLALFPKHFFLKSVIYSHYEAQNVPESEGHLIQSHSCHANKHVNKTKIL